MAEELVRFSWGRVAKPAVRVVTDWKKDACSFWERGRPAMVRGLLYSKAKNSAAPDKISTAVEASAILLWRVSRRKGFPFFTRVSRSTRSTSHQTM